MIKRKGRKVEDAGGRKEIVSLCALCESSFTSLAFKSLLTLDRTFPKQNHPAVESAVERGREGKRLDYRVNISSLPVAVLNHVTLDKPDLVEVRRGRFNDLGLRQITRTVFKVHVILVRDFSKTFTLLRRLSQLKPG